jgi:TatA/E family protein of Tat protein translocase
MEVVRIGSQDTAGRLPRTRASHPAFVPKGHPAYALLPPMKHRPEVTMGALSPVHLILVLLVVLIVFGPGKLREVGEALGRGDP